MGVRILYIAEIVGKTGVFVVKKLLPELRRELRPDLVVACADGATGGSGLGRSHAVYLRKLGADVLTTGERGFYKRDIVDFFPKVSWLLRPANYPAGVPGQGWRVYQAGVRKIAVIQLLGQAGFARTHLANPFLLADDLVPRLRQEAPVVLVEFHAATTSEKITMAAHLDGRVTAVIGAHTRIPTADARISARGTAAITDAGRTGSFLSVGGMDPEDRIREYLTGIPGWSKDGKGDLELQGCLVEAGEDGLAVSIQLIRRACKEVMIERTGNGDED
ncbi:MAG TPA: TIGR00282 family metallophosphoesterase [Magnetospirillaceae bacterium]|nr:TIGR00282 family metallophosphoesterase [Magnetospirillaceae bacterium]